MNRAPSFRAVDEAPNPSAFIDFLDAAERLPGVTEAKELMVSELALGPGDDVLDVGSGLGSDALRCAREVAPGGRVIGLDKSALLLEEARRRTAGGLPVTFCQGEAEALPFPDASFNACRAERLLLHLDDPAGAVVEMARVLRPGGRLCVFDIDWPTLAVDHPDQGLTSAVLGCMADRRLHPALGRALPRLLRSAGLEAIRLFPRAIQLDYEFFIRLRRDALEQSIAQGLASREALARWEQDLRAASERGHFVAFVTGVAASGRKPLQAV